VLASAILTHTRITSLALAVLCGNTVRTETLGASLVESASTMNRFWFNASLGFSNLKDRLTTACKMAFWATMYVLAVLIKGVIALVVGTVFVVAWTVGFVAGFIWKLSVHAARFARKQLLSWLGVTAEIEELKTANAKLQIRVRGLEIIQQVENHEAVLQAAADVLADQLDAEFQARIEALSGEELKAVWLALHNQEWPYSTSEVDRAWVVDDVMWAAPIDRLKAMAVVTK